MTDAPRLTVDEINALMIEEFPVASQFAQLLTVGSMTAWVKMKVTAVHLRPGGSVSGPAIFTLADCSFYLATLAMIGAEPLTVTTSGHIDFLRKARCEALYAKAEIIKLSRSQSIGEVRIFDSELGRNCIALATFTYAIPDSGRHKH